MYLMYIVCFAGTLHWAQTSHLWSVMFLPIRDMSSSVTKNGMPPSISSISLLVFASLLVKLPLLLILLLFIVVLLLVALDLQILGMDTAGKLTVVPWMKAPTLTATTAKIWVIFRALFGCLKKVSKIVSNYRTGITLCVE